jgi:hypothetical protein
MGVGSFIADDNIFYMGDDRNLFGRPFTAGSLLT